jgi:hypothetical protein
MSINTLSLDQTLSGILLRFVVNIVVLFILIRIIYYKYSRKEELLFSFFMMGIMIFLIVSLLETVEIQVGMALGLFAIFAILRFRTKSFSAKDMTYIFTIIGISVINSQANIPPPVLGAIVINTIILVAAFILEIYLQKRTFSSNIIIYNKIKLLDPDSRKDLLKELSAHTGQKIEKVNIRKIIIGKGNAEIEVFFKEKNIWIYSCLERIIICH